MSRSENITGLVMEAKWNRRIVFILLVFLGYLIYLVVQLFNRKDVSSYQVRAGSLAINNVYEGVVLREEQVVSGNDSGYITYFAREGEHVGVGDLVYAIDETGALNEMASAPTGESSLSEEDLRDLRADIIHFSGTFSEKDFHSAYDFLYDMDGSLLKLANINVLNSIDTLGGVYSSDMVKLSKAQKPGYVVYHSDGMESLTSEELTPALFDEAEYEKTPLANHALVDKNAAVYKLLTSENWSVVIQVDPERGEQLKQEGYVQVRFLKNQQVLWGQVSIIPYDQKVSFCLLSFNNSVVNFCTDRFLEIELDESNEAGLKIPLSAIVHKEFFLVPKDYLIEQGEDNSCVFLRKTFMEDGTASSMRMTISVYSEDEEYYFVDDSQLRIGDYLLKEGDLAEYPVSMKGELVGVYNINKGYADFRQIVILYQNEEYAIVKSNTTYGLNEYDYIALNASELTDDEFIFE